jgi:HK97 family phage major capsid protein
MDYVTKAVMETALKAINDELKLWIEKANGEVAANTKMSTETKGALEQLSEKATEIVDRLIALEQKSKTMPADTEKALSLGEQFLKHERFTSWQAGGQGALKMDLGTGFDSAVKTAIVNATGQNQPLVPAQRLPGIIYEPNRALTIRDLLPVGTTGSNLIEYTKENVFTNNAGPQYSSPNRENVTKPESGITFTLETTAVITLAHWIPVSKQVLADAPQLMSYINTRLMYGLKLEEEDQLLNGNGTSGNLSGILKSGNYTAYSRAVSGDTKLDTLRRSLTQVSLSEYAADAIVLHPADWEEIELAKDADDRYIYGSPSGLLGPQIWGRRVVPTQAIAEGTFLTGAFSLGAQVWDRQQASITVAYENGTDFVKNMATILAEERIALAVYRPKAFVSGSF